MTVHRAFRFLACLILALLAALPLPAQPGTEFVYARNVAFDYVETDGRSVVFDVRNNNTDLPVNAQQRLAVSNWLVVPPGNNARYEVDEIQWVLYWPDDGSIEGPFGLTDQSSQGPISPAVTQIRGEVVDTFRSVAMQQVRVPITHPVSFGVEERRVAVTIVQSVRVRAVIGGSAWDEPVHPANLAQRDPYLMQFLGDMVINPDSIVTYTRAIPEPAGIDAVREWNGILSRAAANGPIYRVAITHPGVYALRPRDFVDFDLDPAQLTGERIRIFLGNRELHTVRNNVGNTPFLGDASIVFYVPEPELERYPHQPLWIFQLAGDDPLGPAPRMEEITLPREARRRDPEVSITTREFIFEPLQYHRKYPSNATTGNWATSSVREGQFTRVPFQLDGIDETLEATAEITYGGTLPQLTRIAEAYLNGQMIGRQEALRGIGPNVVSSPVSPGVLREGTNELTIHFPETLQDNLETENHLLYASITYPVDPASFPLNRVVRVTGPEGGVVDMEVTRDGIDHQTPAYLLDVTQPFQPALRPSSRARIGAQGLLMLSGRLSASPEGRDFIFSDAAGMRYLGELRPFRPLELLDHPTGADLILIAHPDTSGGLGSHMQRRKDQGQRVELVTTDQIYNHFGFGFHDYEPIHLFLKHAFRDWPGARLQHVILVGEASEYWWHDRFPRDDVAPNQLPTHGYGNPNERVRSDDSYALVAGDGAIPDIELGRVSTDEWQVAESYFTRVFDYETRPPAGPWVRRHGFVTGAEIEFPREAEKIILTELQQNADPVRLYLRDKPFEDYFRIFQRKRSAEMTDAIVDLLSQGALTVTYLGHGGPNLWSPERIFHYRDIPRLQSGGRRPIMLAGSCDTAWVDYPIDPVKRSLGEQFLTAPNGGGIAIFAPIDGTSSFEHGYLLRPFYHAMNQNLYDRVGSVTLYARMQYLLERNQRYVSNQFILLGDPALRIPRPTSNMTLEIEPASFFANQQTRMQVTGTAPNMDWGMADIHVRNSTGEIAVGPLRTPVTLTRFESTVDFPPYVAPGKYYIVVSATNEAAGAFETIEIPIEVKEPAVTLSWETNPPPGTLVRAGQPVELRLLASNPSEDYVENLVLSLREVASDVALTTTPLTLEPGDQLDRTFRIPALAGVSVFEARIDYARRDALQQPLALANAEFRATTPDGPQFGAPQRLVEVERTASPERTIFRVPLYNLTDQTFEGLSAELRLMDREEGSRVGPGIANLRLGPAATRSLVFTATTRFPEGTLPFELVVTGLETETGTLRQVIPMAVAIPRGSDLLVVPGSVRTERREYVRGQTVFVTATVQNRGPEPVSDLTTTLYVNLPWDPASVAESEVNQAVVTFDTPLMPGEQRDVRLRWDPMAGAPLSVRLFVVVNSDKRHPESDFSNNVGDVAVSMRRLPNLSLDHDTIHASQGFVRPGEVVSLTIPYQNLSPFDFAHPFVLQVDAHGSTVAPETIYRATLPPLPSGERGVVQLTWKADGERHRIRINLNEDRDYGEEQADDNVATIQLTYLINESFLRSTPTTFNFGSTFHYGGMTSLYHAPDDSLILGSFPTGGTRLLFDNEHIVGRRIPQDVIAGTGTDNLMAIIGGGLTWTERETPGSTRFRLPLPKETPSTLYDVYFNQLRPERADTVPVNRYRYMIEDDREWRQMNDHRRSRAYIGRFETHDGHLDLAFAPSSTPSRNTIMSVEVIPVAGSYLSAVYELRHGLRPGVLRLNADTPGETRVEFALRLGYKDAVAPEFGPWTAIRDGEALPADSRAKVLQWRAYLIGDELHTPRVSDVQFEFSTLDAWAETRR